MKKITCFIPFLAALAFATAVWHERNARVSMEETLRSIQSQVQELAGQVAQLREEQQRSSAPPQATAEKEDLTAKVAGLGGEVTQLREALAQVQRASAAISNEIATARGANIPFVYPDSTKRADYVFAGYSTPQSSCRSVLWAIRQTDAKIFLQSLTGTVAEGFAKQFQDLPEGVMPGGFRNGAMFKATGFRVIEESSVSDDEMRLKVFLEGSRIIIQPVFKRVVGEWK